MTNKMEKMIEEESSQHELQRLIRWTKDNPKDWSRICNSDSYSPDIEYITNLVERLYEEKLYTVIYFVIFSNHFVSGVNSSITKTMNECFLETPIGILIKRFRKNLKNRAKEMSQLGQSEEDSD